jgi:hypothetical protein
MNNKLNLPVDILFFLKLFIVPIPWSSLPTLNKKKKIYDLKINNKKKSRITFRVECGISARYSKIFPKMRWTSKAQTLVYM